MSKQFHLYANLTVAPDNANEIRRAVKKIEKKLTDDGEWVTTCRVRVDDLTDSTDVRVIIEISGPKLTNVTSARAQFVAFAEAAVSAKGAKIVGLGVSTVGVDENLFEEYPHLQARPAGTPLALPVSVQLAAARNQLDGISAELGQAEEELSRSAALCATLTAGHAELTEKLVQLQAVCDAQRLALQGAAEMRRVAVEEAIAATRAEVASPNPLEA